jgi:hypothetical protein
MTELQIDSDEAVDYCLMCGAVMGDSHQCQEQQMKTVRISATAIDTFRYWQGTDQNLESLLQDLRGETPENQYMRVGRALHKALEQAPVSKDDEGEPFIQAEGIRFIIKPAIELTTTTLKEFKLEGHYQINDGLAVELVGKVDTFEGTEISDYKTMGAGKFNADWGNGSGADRLLDSFQWRAYLDLSGADLFTWKVFEIEWDNWVEFNGIIAYNITGYHQLTQHRYPELGNDVRIRLSEFCDFLELEQMRLPQSSLFDDYCTLQELLKTNRNRSETNVRMS